MSTGDGRFDIASGLPPRLPKPEKGVWPEKGEPAMPIVEPWPADMGLMVVPLRGM
jgi:hypothetical protein